MQRFETTSPSKMFDFLTTTGGFHAPVALNAIRAAQHQRVAEISPVQVSMWVDSVGSEHYQVTM